MCHRDRVRRREVSGYKESIEGVRARPVETRVGTIPLIAHFVGTLSLRLSSENIVGDFTQTDPMHKQGLISCMGMQLGYTYLHEQSPLDPEYLGIYVTRSP